MRNLVALLLLLLPSLSSAATTSTADPLLNGGCFSRAEFRKHYVALKMDSDVPRRGASVFLPLLSDNYSFVLHSYTFDGKVRFLLTVRDTPMSAKPDMECIIFITDEVPNPMVQFGPGTPGVKKWGEGGDLGAVRKLCADSLLPKMIELNNAQLLKLGSTWMTWSEKHAALGRVAGVDVEADRRRAIQDDADRVVNSRSKGDGFCDRFEEIQARQKRRHNKLDVMLLGSHFRGAGGRPTSTGALAMFIPEGKRKENDLDGWAFYMVAKDGRAYLLADGNEVLD